jgi:hypothetical protein
MKSEEYHKQAADFLEKHNIKIAINKAASQGCPLWCDDKHIHGDKWLVVFSREGKPDFSLDFWDSKADKDLRNGGNPYRIGSPEFKAHGQKIRQALKPTAYDILACLEKYEPAALLEDFCADYGYEIHSVKDAVNVQATHQAVIKQYQQAKAFFTDAELEELQEIN